MPAAAIYVRVSTEEQARHGYSLSAQAEACRARALALGAAEVQLFTDEGVSGSLLSRPGLNALREAVRTRAVEAVVVWDPDRLSRNLSHQLLLTEEIERARIRLEFVNFEWKNTPEGQLFYALRGAIAQYEKEKIRERTSRGRLQKAKQGKLPLAFRPYGYDYDPATALLAPSPSEAGVVADMYRWLLDEGEGPAAIARRLNALGVTARKGGRWHRAVVRQVLANPVYMGVFFANRWDAAGVSLNRHRPPAERVHPALRPEVEWVAVEVPPLVEPERWREAQGVLERARRLWAGRPRAFYLLSGLLACGRCGRPMSGVMATDWGRKRRKYTCRQSSGPAGCGRAVVAEPLEEAVWGAVLDLVGDPDRLLAALPSQARSSGGDGGRELAALAEALAQAEKGRQGVLALLEQGLLPPAEAAGSLHRVQTRLAELASRKQALEQAAAQAARAAAVDPVVWRRAAEEALARYRSGAGPEPVERKQLVRMVVERAVAGEGAVAVQVRWPLPAQDLPLTPKS